MFKIRQISRLAVQLPTIDLAQQPQPTVQKRWSGANADQLCVSDDMGRFSMLRAYCTHGCCKRCRDCEHLPASLGWPKPRGQQLHLQYHLFHRWHTPLLCTVVSGLIVACVCCPSSARMHGNYFYQCQEQSTEQTIWNAFIPR